MGAWERADEFDTAGDDAADRTMVIGASADLSTPGDAERAAEDDRTLGAHAAVPRTPEADSSASAHRDAQDTAVFLAVAATTYPGEHGAHDASAPSDEVAGPSFADGAATPDEAWAPLSEPAHDPDRADDEDEVDLSHAPAFLRTAGSWCLRHQGLSIALGAVAFLGVAALGFFLALGAITAGADAHARERTAEQRAAQQATVIDTSLPALGMRFVALSDEAFPTMTLDVALSRSDGQALPELSVQDFVLVERDEHDREHEVEPDPSSFAFDAAAGTARIGFTSDVEDLDADRTLSVSLAKESGYRGGGMVSYEVPANRIGDAAEEADSEYVLSDSSRRRYTAAALEDYTDDELFVARNEIFARHGRMFGDSYLQRHFESTSWYEPRYTAEEFDSMPTPLNEIEIANVNTILQVERSR